MRISDWSSDVCSSDLSPVTLGLITPFSDNFCATCNRIRLTVEGRVNMCLGQDAHVDLRASLREGGDVDGLIDAALASKPRAHDFHIERERSEEHASELQSLMRKSYAVFCL